MKFWMYTALRFLLFGVGFFITVFLTDNVFYALAVGLVVGFALTYLFTPKLRQDASQDLMRALDSRKRNKTAVDDADAEDAYTQGRFADPQDLQRNAEGEQNGVEDAK
ncbi:MAG TPA: DUF4229 domain-containing protein [Enteractinococcus helveticum]|uniref:DUF4229 domain-containing protein n=1 Tax=Enteractinococcus helveticum TaxID=1837282 RepID=A0A921FK45_9MICC|nr:DUF4229 domain-containing protein [Enteractinococcus helveticum]HJF13578.1 DUF4229 domain-containing protein [Enteractinococcus helveticum]